MTTTRYMNWMRAFAAERRAAREIAQTYAAAHANGQTPAEQRVARRALMRANTRHCATMRRERAARARLSRADHAAALAFAQTLVADHHDHGATA
jgi:hypothetical protein